MNNIESLEKAINSELASKIISSKIKHNQIYVTIEDSNLSEVMIFLKTNSLTKFRQLIDITAVDYPEKDKRFKMVYLLLSHETNSRILVDCEIKEGEIVPSLTSIFPAANWMVHKSPFYLLRCNELHYDLLKENLFLTDVLQIHSRLEFFLNPDDL